MSLGRHHRAQLLEYQWQVHFEACRVLWAVSQTLEEVLPALHDLQGEGATQEDAVSAWT